MNGIEVKTRINEIDSKIAKAVNTFILSPEIKDLMAEKATLRAQCTHEFENGVCIYCGKENNE